MINWMSSFMRYRYICSRFLSLYNWMIFDGSFKLSPKIRKWIKINFARWFLILKRSRILWKRKLNFYTFMIPVFLTSKIVILNSSKITKLQRENALMACKSQNLHNTPIPIQFITFWSHFSLKKNIKTLHRH